MQNLLGWGYALFPDIFALSQQINFLQPLFQAYQVLVIFCNSKYIREEEKEFLFQGNLVLRFFNNLAHYIVNQLNDSVASVRDL